MHQINMLSPNKKAKLYKCLSSKIQNCHFEELQMVRRMTSYFQFPYLAGLLRHINIHTYYTILKAVLLLAHLRAEGSQGEQL